MSIIMRLVPLPRIDKCKKALFIGPHPDDIEIGAGGLASKLVREGSEVYYLICCDGGCGTPDKNADPLDIANIRKKEAIEASKIIGAKEVKFLDYPDGGIYSVDDLRVDIAKVILDIKPDLIVCPSPFLKTETHMDHIRVAEACRTSLLIAKFPLVAKRQGMDITNIEEYCNGITLAYYFSADVNQIVKIKKEDLENKINALKKHASQMDSNIVDVFKYINFKAKIFGIKKFARFGEGYFVLGPVHQHCFCENI